MKIKRKFVFAATTLFVTATIPFLGSCSSKTTTQKIDLNIVSNLNNYICYIGDEIKLIADMNTNDIGDYRFEWSCQELDGFDLGNEVEIVFPTDNSGEYNISLAVFNHNNQIIAQAKYTLIIKSNPQQTTPNYSLSLQPSKSEINFGDQVVIDSSLTPSEQTNNSLLYKWFINNTLIVEELNKTSITISDFNIGKNLIGLEIYLNNELIAQNQIEINVLESNNSLLIPTREQLHIDDNIRTDYVYSDFRLSQNNFKTKFNEYGLLESLSLLGYMLIDSDDFINSNNYENIQIKLIKNHDFSNIEIQISGTLKQNISLDGVGKKLPFSPISEGFNGMNLVGGDNVQFNFEIQKTNPNSTYYNLNQIDPNNIIIGTTLTDLFKWNKIGSTVKLAYTANEFTVNSTLYKNGKIIRFGNENRCFIPFIYYASREYPPISSGHFLGQTSCVN